ncbi:MAG: SMP-30/gluconolactonase/LRE family protein [Gammaproteobacteria bacterium]|nr:SMP-30/gluconolactonase/LRE family protein [Gammaproteobacteria bacterium]
MDQLAQGYGLIEGPVWEDSKGLLFSDVLFGGVFRLGLDGAVETVFEHRRGIGGMALHEAGGLIVSGRNLSFKPFSGGATVTVLEQDEPAGVIGFNDLTTDAAGRVYAGALGASPVFDDGREPRAGDLYLVDLDGSARVVAHDVQLTNGLGFSPDGATLYHSDSRRQTVFCYSVAADGGLGEKRVFVETEDGSPDGLAVSEDGAVWVALAGGNGVGVYSASGVRQDFIEIPQPMCTSVCFGGADRRDLYIVSGSEGSQSDRAGAVFRIRTDVAGLPVAAARTRLGGTD